MPITCDGSIPTHLVAHLGCESPCSVIHFILDAQISDGRPVSPTLGQSSEDVIPTSIEDETTTGDARPKGSADLPNATGSQRACLDR